MAYFPVDDDMAFHPKVLAAGNEAIGLWTRAGSLCKKHTTGGFVTIETARALGSKKLADRLVAAGLWAIGDGGYYFHDWTDQAGNGTADEEKERRDRNLERNARRQAIFRDPTLRQAIRGRDGNSCRYCGREVNWNDRRGELGGTYDHIDPEGQNSLDNLVVSCRRCNSAKGRRTPEAAGMPLRDPGLIPNPGQVRPSSDLHQSLIGPDGPSPSPMTDLTVSESSHEIPARASTDAVVVSEMTRRLAAQQGITNLAVIAASVARHTGITVTGDQAFQVALWILGKAARPPAAPERYVVAAIAQSPFEVQKHIHEAVA